MPDRKG